jgi:L-amino acid N-acyltransferase YncA
MAIDDCEITEATAEDIGGILDMQGRNQPERGGALSAPLPREWLDAAVSDMPVIVATKQGHVVGYLISASREAYAGMPVVTAMLRAYPGAASDAYVYGPVCVGEEARGRGLAAAMSAALRAGLPGRKGVLFIRHDNAASLRAHEKTGMREVAGFAYGAPRWRCWPQWVTATNAAPFASTAARLRGSAAA